MKFLKQNFQKEPWQIAAARYCVSNAEKGFTKKGLEGHIELSYSVNKNHIEQFYNEEIYKPAGREHTRNFVKTEDGGLWTPPLDLVSQITDYDELKEARENAKNAFRFSIIAIIISSVTLWTSIQLGENQIETSHEQVIQQNAIWLYETNRNDRIEAREVEWRRQDLLFRGQPLSY